MLSHEETHIELARTVEDLTQWLSVVEVGLSAMLDSASEDTIAEEREDYTRSAEVRTDAARITHTLKADLENGLGLGAKP